MLEIKNLSASRRHSPILRNVSLSVPKNKITVLVCKNGSGKTTLSDCICGLLPYSGEILLDGQPLAMLSPKNRAKQIAYLPQLLPTPHMTAYELIALGRSPYMGISLRLTAEDLLAVKRASTLTHSESLIEKFVDELSGGELRRIYLAMTLAQDSDLLVLDEPTTHMDISAKREFLDMLQRLVKQEEKTLLVILHDLTDTAKYADNIAILEHGELAFFGTREQCLDEKSIERVFGVKRFDINNEVIFHA